MPKKKIKKKVVKKTIKKEEEEKVDDIFTSHKIEMTDEFIEALEIMEYSNQPIYITGKAGTGKSTLLTHFRDNTKKVDMYTDLKKVKILYDELKENDS